MKKILTLTLCLVMAFSMAACEELEALKNVELPPPPTAKEVEKTPESPAPTPETKEKAVEEIKAEPVENLIIVRNEKTVMQDYDPAEGTQLILTFSYDTPKVYIEGRDDVSAKINEYIGILDDTYYTGATGTEYDIAAPVGYNMLLQEAQDNFTYYHNNNVDNVSLEFSSVRDFDVERGDGNVLSLVFHSSTYTGGAHGNYVDTAYVFDTQTGERLTLADLSSDYDALATFLTERMVEMAKSNESYKEQITNITPEEYAENFAKLLRDGSWYFNNEGLVIFSFAEEFGSYSAGIVSFTIPYAELKGKIDDRFIPEAKNGNGEFQLSAMKDVPNGSFEMIDKLNILPEGVEGEELCLSAKGNVYDVELVNVSYADKFYELEPLWYASEMGDSALQLLTVIPEGVPNLMLKYRLADGTEQRFLISQSGQNGSYTLVNDDIEAVG